MDGDFINLAAHDRNLLRIKSRRWPGQYQLNPLAGWIRGAAVAVAAHHGDSSFHTGAKNPAIPRDSHGKEALRGSGLATASNQFLPPRENRETYDFILPREIGIFSDLAVYYPSSLIFLFFLVEIDFRFLFLVIPFNFLYYTIL